MGHRLGLVARDLLGVDPPADLIERMVEAYHSAWMGGLALMPGAIEILEGLKAEHRMALITDFSPAPGLWQILNRFGLERYFQTVIISEDIGHTKPHPSIFHAALDNLGASPSECVFVGDNLVCDIQGARQAGMLPVLLDVDDLHPEHDGERICDLRELPPLLRQLGKS